MLKKLFPEKVKPQFLLILILTLALILRIYGINFPNTYVFDEVYYAFTAQEYLKGNPDAWGWWGTAPQGFAYAWVNPPFPQEVMAISMFLSGSQSPWAWRIPGVLLGVLSVYLVYWLGKTLFRNEYIGVLAAFIFSLDGLNFVQSRIGMIDIYLVTFVLLSLVFLIKKDFLYSAVFLGLALGGKWTAVYLFPLILFLVVKYKMASKLLVYAFIVPAVYMLVYLPFFLHGNDAGKFIELFKQQWWYHINLKATHDYASAWWSWPLALSPVWYYVQYYPNNSLSNIFSAGNPLVFLGGSLATIVTLWEVIKKRSEILLILILGVIFFWLPWAFSPRIMFFYYFSPAVPFVSLILAYQLAKLWQKNQKPVVIIIVSLVAVGFVLLYPLLVGLPLPKDLILFFFRTNLSKNPFG